MVREPPPRPSRRASPSARRRSNRPQTPTLDSMRTRSRRRRLAIAQVSLGEFHRAERALVNAARLRRERRCLEERRVPRLERSFESSFSSRAAGPPPRGARQKSAPRRARLEKKSARARKTVFSRPLRHVLASKSSPPSRSSPAEPMRERFPTGGGRGRRDIQAPAAQVVHQHGRAAERLVGFFFFSETQDFF